MASDDDEKSIMSVELDADTKESNSVRLNINVIFDTINIKRGVAYNSFYSVATRGATIEVQLKGGRILNHTGEQSLAAEHTRRWRRKRKIDANVGVKLGSGQFLGETDVENEAKIKIDENEMAVISRKTSVKWSLKKPNIDLAFRNYYEGTRIFFTNFFWENQDHYGNISFEPSDVRFFGPGGQPLSEVKSLIMRFILWKRGIPSLRDLGKKVSLRIPVE